MIEPHAPVIIIGAAFILLLGSFIGCRILNKIDQYRFFSHYVGPRHAQYVMSYRNAARLYKMLTNIKNSSDGEPLFDIAMRYYLRNRKELDVGDTTIAMLKYFDKKYFKNTKTDLVVDDAYFTKHWYTHTRLTSRIEILRVLLWLLIINPKTIVKITYL